jgi:hypothetical protein
MPVNQSWETYLDWRLTVSVIATIGLYSVLYRENKFYRLFEHLFLGLAAGWTMVSLWTETLDDLWWNKMMGSHPDPVTHQGATIPGYWAYMLLLPLGLMGYFVYSKKHNWISRIPIGLILGFWSGQQVQVWWTRYGPQISDSMKPVFPNTFAFTDQAGVSHFSLTTPPATAVAVPGSLYATQSISNLIFVLTFICVLSYFLFSFDLKNRLLSAMATSGRWLLMVGFGAIFGSTVMMRFTLLIDRMYFIWIEWLRDRIVPLIFHR